MGKPTIWYAANLAILRKYYGKEPLEKTHERIVRRLERDTAASGKKGIPIPTVSGLIYAARKAGIITPEEADAAYKERQATTRRENYRARRGPKADGHISLEARQEVTERDGERCQYCGARGTAVDHIQPVSRGGTGDTWNLTLACTRCNSSKGGKLLAAGLLSTMQRLLQGGWKYKGKPLYEAALARFEKAALKDGKGSTPKNNPKKHLTLPYSWCERCYRISDTTAVQVGMLTKTRRLVAICNACGKPAELRPLAGLFEVGQRLYPYEFEALGRRA